jgi:uncharacterized protein (DUF2267 family)
MTTTGLDVFDRTIHTSNVWLNELMQNLGWQDRHGAYLALRATLHALRDRLAVDEMAHLGAQLPLVIRGMYYDGWNPGGQPVKIRTREEFLDRVAAGFGRSDDPIDREAVARAVFALLASRVTAGEVEDVTHVLPAEIRSLWPESRRHAA